MIEPAATRIGDPRNLPAYLLIDGAVLACIRAIAALKVADYLGDEPMSIADLAMASGTHVDGLQRVLSLLIAEGLFGSTADGRITHNEFSRMLRSDHPHSVRAGQSLLNHAEAALGLAAGLRTGETPYVARFGKPLFEHMADDPNVAQTFAEFMSATTAWAENAIFESHVFRPFALAVDVGGSHGSLLRRLLAQHPGAQGILFDLPHVASAASVRWTDSPVADRLRATGGSFFSAVPEGADLYLLKQVLHDWTDDECITILRNVRRAMVVHGRLAIIEQLLPESWSSHPVWAMDIWMLIVSGGRERKLSEFERLLRDAGLVLDRVTPTQSPLNVIEAVAK